MPPVEPAADNIKNLYSQFTATPDDTPADGIKAGSGFGMPAYIGKAIYQKDLDWAKMVGIKSMPMLFGKKVSDNDRESTAVPVNFGSKSSTGMLPEETRLRLFYFKKLFNNVEIQACVKGQTRNPTKAMLKSVTSWPDFEAACKAFNITDFDDWIDQVQARFFFEEYEIPYVLADQFDSLPMTSPIVRVPGALGLLEGTLESDDAIFTPQSNTQSSYIVESKNNVVHTVITQDLLDDSSPPLIDKLRKEVLMGIVRSYERCILDGVEAPTVHIDDDTQAGPANLFSKAFTGLRKRVFDGDTLIGAGSLIYDNSGDPLNKDTFSELLKRLKCQGSEKDDLVYIMGCTGSHDLVTGAIPELFTAFAFGGLASNVTGNVPPVFGVKPIESSRVREDLDADGKANSPAVETLTYMLLVQKSRYSNWIRQATRVFASPSLPNTDTMLMTGKARHAFAGIPIQDKERSAAMAINIKTV
jgi:hypothetical protein